MISVAGCHQSMWEAFDSQGREQTFNVEVRSCTRVPRAGIFFIYSIKCYVIFTRGGWLAGCCCCYCSCLLSVDVDVDGKLLEPFRSLTASIQVE